MTDHMDGNDESVTFLGNPLGVDLAAIEEAQKSDEAIIEDIDTEGTELTLEDPTETLQSLAEAIHEVEQEEIERMEQSFEDQVEAIDQPSEADIEEEMAQTLRMIQTAQAEHEEASAKLPENIDLEETQSIVEALIFASDRPISVNKIFDLLNPEEEEPVEQAAVAATEEKTDEVEETEKKPQPKSSKKKKEPLVPYSWIQEAVQNLKAEYNTPKRGFELVEVANGLQFRTKPGKAIFLRRLTKIQVQRLSAGALESLCIIAYKQPVMKEEIDQIRGVDSSYFIRSLMDRGLIQIDGRSDLPGRPIVYSTSEQFLKLFGLKDLKSLPPLEELQGMVPASETKNPDEEDPRVLNLRKMVQDMKSDQTRIIYDPKEDEQILKEIREKVGAIPVSTPYLEEQKRMEQEAQQPSSS